MKQPQKAPCITLAKHAGFCFGVRRATDMLEALLDQRQPGERIVTLGQLIHNDTYHARMAARGVEIVEPSGLDALIRSADATAPVTLLIRAHGIPQEMQRVLQKGAEQNSYFRYVDCTCPYVTRIHDIVSEHGAPDRQLWVFGSESHPEVEGIVSRFDGDRFVFGTLEQFKQRLASGELPDPCQKKPIVVEQTTYLLVEWTKCQKFVENLCTNALIFDTICNVTELRQAEAKTMASTCDCMIVVGGKQSSNTRKLADVCRSQGARTLLVEHADELEGQIPASYEKVGIVAGNVFS